MLSSCQFSFTTGKSTADAVVKLVESMNDISRFLSVVVDFRKPFDAVSHSILLQKLFLYGVWGLSLSLLRSYLNNRPKCVRLANVCSDNATINIASFVFFQTHA